MHQFGFEGILAEAAAAKQHGATVAPHNWGHLIAFTMQLQLGRAITNLYRAEHDPLTSDVIVSEGTEIRDGSASVPQTPGCGLRVDEKQFATQARLLYDVS